MQTYIYYIHRVRDTYIQKARLRQTGRPDRQTYRQTDRHTNRQETERGIERQRRQRKRERDG